MTHREEYLQTQCRKIFIRDFCLSCHIGAYENEKHRTQKVRFNCDIWVPLSASTSRSDNLSDVLNYDLIVDTIRRISLSDHFNLQETLVDTIADALINLPDIVCLRLSSAKLEAYTDVGEAGIEIWRFQKEISQ